jgi:DNA-binding transcriptional LysR family regulator
MLNMRSVDLNLLPVFEAAYEERSLSRAALRLAVTQSAVSHALARLRVLFKDQLFVRHARGVTPTPTADSIYERARPALGLVREAVTQSRGFDPSTSERQFFVAIPHPLGPMIAVRLLESLRETAPRVRVAFNTSSRPADLERSLREGRVDAAIDWVPAAGEHFREEVVFRDNTVIVARKGHAILRGPVDRKALRKHAFVRLRPRSESSRLPESATELRSLELRFELEVSEALEVFMVVASSDLLGIVPGSMAGMAHSILGMEILHDAPHGGPTPVRMLWHQGRERDPGHRFLRKVLHEAARDVVRG